MTTNHISLEESFKKKNKICWWIETSHLCGN